MDTTPVYALVIEALIWAGAIVFALIALACWMERR